MNLIDFLRSAGADISIRYDHTIIINWVEELVSELSHGVCSDYIQSGTYMVIAALCSKDYLDIKTRVSQICMHLYKNWKRLVWRRRICEMILSGFLRQKALKGLLFKQIFFPGFPTDLQSPFSILMTQAEGISKIHEVLFEWRLHFLIELEKWRQIRLLWILMKLLFFDRRKLISNTTVASWDLRAGVAMIIAGLIAQGETRITNVEYIHRWYEDIINVLSGLGADIKQINS